jgi:hypothetical protein
MALDFTNGQANWDQLAGNLKPGALGGEKKNYKDDRFWSITRDETDTGTAIIRLLPDPDGTPFIKVYSHAIQSYDPVKQKKRWYLNTSPETVDQDCPASELWSLMYNLGTNEAKEEAKMFSRKINYYTNVLVVNDPAKPENNGKIMLWKFGTKLFDKFMAALNPSEQDRKVGEKPKELFNPLTGCNIKLKIKKSSGFFNYDDTTIEPASAIWPDGETAKASIIEFGHKLDEFLQPEKFDTYEESLKRLKWVCETYSPKHLDPVMFKQLVDQVGIKDEAGTAPAQPAQPTQAAAPVQEAAPVATPPTVAPTVAPTATATPVATAPTAAPTATAPIAERQVEKEIVADSSTPTQTVTSTPPATGGSVDDDLDFLNDLD